MPRLWRSLFGRVEDRSDPQISMQDWYEMMSYQGLNYLMSGTTTSVDTESIENSFLGYIHGLYKTNGVVFALMEARRSVFSEARFQFQRIKNGRPGDLFGSPALSLLEYPWPNGTTGELLSRAIQDVDLTGNHYVVREADRLRRLRPDWVQIILSAPPDQSVKSDVLGYAYWPGGINNGDPEIYTVTEMAHWCPIPDPEAQYRGMSWLTPVLREIQADKEATAHKGKFYANAATPKLSVSLKETVTKEQFVQFMDAFEAANGGIENAYKTIYLGGGADVQMVGANMVQMDFKNVQGAGETRIAAAAGVPSVVVGFSEGMQGSSLNAGNYKSAKENYAERTLRPLWRSIAAAYQTITVMPSTNGTTRLWYDDRDIAFLRTDRLEAAKIQTERVSNLNKLITAGFTPDSSVNAVNADDLTMLEHTGLTSVQLIPPGTTPGAAPGAPSEPPSLPPGGTAPKALPPGQSGTPGIKVTPPKAEAQSNSRWALIDLSKWQVESRHGSKSDPGYFVYHPGSAAKSGTLKDGANKADKNFPLSYYQLDGDEDQFNQDLDTYWNYSADGWSDAVANYLRTGESDPDEIFDNDEMDEMVSAMDGVAAAHVLESSVQVYRVAPKSIYGDVPDGTVVTDKAFMSTTGHRVIAEKYKTQSNDTLMRIDLPVGTHMIPHFHLGGGAKGEVILPRNMPFRKVRMDGDVAVYEPVF